MLSRFVCAGLEGPSFDIAWLAGHCGGTNFVMNHSDANLTVQCVMFILRHIWQSFEPLRIVDVEEGALLS